MERRDFLKTAGSGVAALTASSFQKIHGANDRLRIGLIGEVRFAGIEYITPSSNSWPILHTSGKEQLL